MLYIILMYISHFMIFLLVALLAVYFIFILDYRNDVRRKSKFKRFSYWNLRWVIKQQTQLATSAMHLAQELLMNIQCGGGSRSFAEETRALRMRSTVSGHCKLTTTNREDHQS